MGWGFLGVIDFSDRLYMWGDNYWGQLGLGDEVHRDDPIAIKSLYQSRVKAISLGFQHTLILDENGKVYGVGKNNKFQLTRLLKESNEYGEIMDKYGLPQEIIFEERIAQISAGKFHSLFLTESNKLYSTGFNMHGQTGFSNTLYDHIEVPTEVDTAGIKIAKIVSGNHHNLILSEDGKLYGFGSSVSGQIDGKPDGIRHEQFYILE